MSQVEREALYYPYVHIRDDDWLKKTLLVFPGVVRMIADDFVPDDGPLVRALSQRGGRRQLMRRATLDSKPVRDAQKHLVALLENDLAEQGEPFRARFDKAAATALNRKTKSPFGFQMHLGKTSLPLAQLLQRERLAWKPDHPDRKEYFEMHPRIGQAVLGTIAVECARDQGLDIVAQSQDDSSRELNACLASTEIDVVYDTFVRDKPLVSAAANDETSLLEVIVYCHCDVSRLDADALVALMDERDALRDLKAELEKMTRVPAMRDPVEHRRRLQDEAADVLRRWTADRANLSGFARKIFAAESLSKGISEVAKAAIEKVGLPIATATTAAAFGAPLYASAAGLLVSFGVHAGFSAMAVRDERKHSPYRYLTSAAEKGVVFTIAH